MTLRTWLLFLAMEIALSLSPGPAVFYVVSQGVRAFARAVPATLGILSANALYFALSATSLGALIAASARFFTVAKWLGAAYLVYLAIQALRAAATAHAVTLEASGPVHPAALAAGGRRDAAVPGGLVGDRVPRDHSRRDPVRRDAARRIYFGALTLQLSNPKALLFFLALLPQFVDTHRAVAPQLILLAATSMLPELFILLSYGWLANRAARASARFGVTGPMNRWLGWIEGIGLLACATLVLRFGRAT